MKSKAIVFVAMSYPTGGVRHFGLLGLELYRRNRDANDFYVASIGLEQDAGFWQMLRAEIPEERLLVEWDTGGLFERIVNLTRDYEKVLVHAGGGWAQTKFFLRARRKLDRKLARRIVLVGTTHSYKHDMPLRIPMSMFQCALYLLFYRMIVFQCRYARDRFWGGNLLTWLGKGTVIPLGCEEFPAVGEDVPTGIRELGLEAVARDRSLFKIVYLALIRPGKMHVWLVEAAAPFLRRHPEARLILCGKEFSQEVAAQLRGEVGKLGLGGQVIIPGQVPRNEVPWLLQHMNCAVVPSRAETFGHNFLEPMFAGLPVVGTRVGVGRDIIREGETGRFIDLGDKAGVADALEGMIADPAKTARMGANAKALVEKAYLHAHVAQQLTALYGRLLGE